MSAPEEAFPTTTIGSSESIMTVEKDEISCVLMDKEDFTDKDLRSIGSWGADGARVAGWAGYGKPGAARSPPTTSRVMSAPGFPCPVPPCPIGNLAASSYLCPGRPRLPVSCCHPLLPVSCRRPSIWEAGSGQVAAPNFPLSCRLPVSRRRRSHLCSVCPRLLMPVRPGYLCSVDDLSAPCYPCPVRPPASHAPSVLAPCVPLTALPPLASCVLSPSPSATGHGKPGAGGARGAWGGNRTPKVGGTGSWGGWVMGSQERPNKDLFFLKRNP
ncbi:hypothetical protein EYF80_003217 [Liparis tanakae]|uniref:Uncharacterized protein n=1 Tax=Liparis tanakae TaxID=230148 RepID=A0A4Z2J8U6_9TELE|nr:hypothetical protein EYF80_003217 [Liparis tanakae]